MVAVDGNEHALGYLPDNVLGSSAIRTGIAYLPFAVGVVLASALASQLVPRIGARPLILAALHRRPARHSR